MVGNPEAAQFPITLVKRLYTGQSRVGSLRRRVLYNAKICSDRALFLLFVRVVLLSCIPSSDCQQGLSRSLVRPPETSCKARIHWRKYRCLPLARLSAPPQEKKHGLAG